MTLLLALTLPRTVYLTGREEIQENLDYQGVVKGIAVGEPGHEGRKLRWETWRFYRQWSRSTKRGSTTSLSGCTSCSCSASGLRSGRRCRPPRTTSSPGDLCRAGSRASPSLVRTWERWR